MERLDRILIRFALRPGFKALAYLFCGLCGILLAGDWRGAALMALPLLADVRGACLIKRYYDGFRQDLLEILEEEARAQCGVSSSGEAFALVEYQGLVDHWLVKSLPDQADLTLVAPLPDYLVIARKWGRIFPPAGLSPLRYETADRGSMDVYFRDISHVEVDGGLIRMHTVGGAVVEYQDHGQEAGAAVEAIRNRLRSHKSRLA